MQMDKLTFEQLPTAINQLFNKLETIEELLQQQHPVTATPPKDELLNVQQTAEFLNLKVPTIYSKVSRSELPVMKKGNRLYFSQKELSNYLQSGRRKTNAEIAADAAAYLKKNK